MAADSDVDTASYEQEELYRWRRSRFRRLGCDRKQATALALSEADYHQAENLVAHGCPPRLLIRLLL